ncbi:MAG: TetR/AcrR family transcriptional regulator [Candidatus Methanomethylicus sp.]|nr:TetR/AcrR family transcriptional regulator [Candidatus Methanomethylicus sp.]
MGSVIAGGENGAICATAGTRMTQGRIALSITKGSGYDQGSQKPGRGWRCQETMTRKTALAEIARRKMVSSDSIEKETTTRTESSVGETDTIKRIMEAALRLFSSEGYSGVTTKRLASEAGVNEITLFRRFKSKENILRAVFDFNLKKIEGIIDKNLLLEEDADFESCILSLIKELGVEAGDLGAMALSFKKTNEMPLVAASMGKLVKAVNERLCRFFEFQMQVGNIRKVNPMALSTILFGFIASQNMPRLPKDPHAQFEVMSMGVSSDEFIDLIMNGIVMPKANG